MRMKKHYKLIISGILIFISGLLIGAGIAYVAVEKRHRQVDPLEKFRTDLFKIMVQELDLTPEQQIKTGKFLDKAMKRMKKFRVKHMPEILMIIKENHQDLKKILTPEQWEIYEGYRNKALDRIQKDIP